MQIEQIDKNFKIATDITEPNIVWYSARRYPFSLHGIFYDDNLKKFLRMPQKTADTVSNGVGLLNDNTAGGRIRFKTDSSYIAIRAIMNPSANMPHMPRTGQSGFDLYCYFNGRERFLSAFIPPVVWETGYSCGIKTYGEKADYTINFPLYDGVKDLYIGIKKGSVLEQATPYLHTLPIVFYGSSITQGGCASRPGNSYQSFLSRHLSVDFINLGFSGSAKGERKMAEYIANLSMSIFVMDYDFNAPSEEWLDKTHFAFYETIRGTNPYLPIILISAPSSIYEFYQIKQAKEWGVFENRRKIIYSTFIRAREKGDDNIYFIDGKNLFTGEDWDATTVDGTHPNDFGFFCFAQNLEKVISPLLDCKKD